MMFWVGTTDTRWFEFLAPRHLDEVSFWQPSVRPAFENAPSGMPFVFKVKRPHNHIAGAGYFVTRSVLPLDLAWEISGQKNGAASLSELRELLGPLADRGTHPHSDHLPSHRQPRVLRCAGLDVRPAWLVSQHRAPRPAVAARPVGR